MKSEWVTHKGRSIFCCCYFGLDIAELKAEVEANRAIISAQPEKSVLLLVDTRGIATMSLEAIGILKDSDSGMAAGITKYIRKLAMIGDVSGPVRGRIVLGALLLFLRFVGGMQSAIFDNIEDAKDWLVCITR